MDGTCSGKYVCIYGTCSGKYVCISVFCNTKTATMYVEKKTV
jgi:hypothetical protein